MSGGFDVKVLKRKLSEMTKSKRSIDSLSKWCTYHWSEAEAIVAMWYKELHNSDMERRIPLLHIANDILHRSRSEGSEFVDRFWDVLPAAIRFIIENGDDYTKNAVSRLVGKWEDRKIFISHARSIRETMLPYLPQSSSLIIRKLTTAFELVLKDCPSEGEEIRKCKSAIDQIRELGKEVEIGCPRDLIYIYREGRHSKAESTSKELLKKERILRESVEKLKLVESNRVALVSQLREALLEQESKLRNLQSEMEDALSGVVKASSMQKKLKYGGVCEQTNGELAAVVADKLAASDNPQQILASVLSDFLLSNNNNNNNNNNKNNNNNNNIEVEKPYLKTSQLLPPPDLSRFCQLPTEMMSRIIPPSFPLPMQFTPTYTQQIVMAPQQQYVYSTALLHLPLQTTSSEPQRRFGL